MSRKLTLPVLLLAFALICSQAIGQTRLGLHYTKEELDIWKQRAVSGPYRVGSDAQTNSPNDWGRITTNANTFKTSPSANRWIPSFSGCVGNSTSLPTPQQYGYNIRDAAFYYLITGNTAYADAVRGELLAQAAEPATNFANTSIWCPGKSGDSGPAFSVSEWLTRLMFAYDYIKDRLSAADKATLNAWFKSGALYIQSNYDITLNSKFVDRANGNYSLTSAALNMETTLSTPELIYYGGPRAHHMAKCYNNRMSAMGYYVGVAGIFLNDAALQTSGKRFFKEWLMFGVFPDAMVADMHRGVDSNLPDKGFAYAHSSAANMSALADVFARNGDVSLFKYATMGGTLPATSGTDATYVPSNGTPKSLLRVIKNLCDLRNGIRKVYATSDSTKNENEHFLAEGTNAISRWYSVFDVYFSWANVYYRDSYIKATYLRTAPGSVPYPSSIASNGPTVGWTAAGAPAILFLYGQIEDQVWPFPIKEVKHYEKARSMVEPSKH
jgi:hypothetical protein